MNPLSAAPAAIFERGRKERGRARKDESGNTPSKSVAKMCIGPDKEGWWDVVMRIFGLADGLLKKEANSSLFRSASNSSSLGSAMNVSSYSRRLSKVAGTLFFSRS